MCAERNDDAKFDDEPIEAGEVGELKELSFHEAKHRAETAKTLATWLVIILGVSVALHYVLTAILAYNGKDEAIKSLNSIFNSWLPVVKQDPDGLIPLGRLSPRSGWIIALVFLECEALLSQVSLERLGIAFHGHDRRRVRLRDRGRSWF